MKYLYVDIDKFVMKYNYSGLIVELIPFGLNKVRTQKVTMKLIDEKQNSKNVYDTAEDLIVAENDYQDYTIHVSKADDLTFLGEFKLCDLIKK